MKILLIEDDEIKKEHIEKYVYTIFPEIYLVIRKSYQTALKEILNNSFDLLLLDMSMPTFDRSMSNGSLVRFRDYGGRDILSEMRRKKINIKTIVITQYGMFGEGNNQITSKDLDDELLKSFHENYIGMVYYNASLLSWKEELLKLIKQNILGGLNA